MSRFSINNFRKANQREYQFAKEIAEAFDFKYEDLSRFQRDAIYCLVKRNDYKHAALMNVIEQYKNSKHFFIVLAQYAKGFEIAESKHL